MKIDKCLMSISVRHIMLLTCLVFSAIQLAAQEPNDCVNAITVCGNGSFMSNAVGSGNEFEVNSCSGFEHNSLWLEVYIVQAGTLGFDLIPNDPDINVDYDFWVYGPNVNCGAIGNPIRCATTNPAQAGLVNNHTGINGSTTLTQTGPGANGNGYVYWLNVNVGESYYIVIDRPAGDGGFELQWTGTANQGTGAFPSQPNVNEIDDVVQCSSTPDLSVFDLNGLSSSINSDAGTTVEYFASLADAVDNINQLPGIYANTSNPQTIYAKATNGSNDCYNITEFDLVVSPIPEATLSVSDTEICEGDTVTFTIQGTPNATVNYTINGGTSQQITLDATGEATLIETPVTDITVTLENAQVIAGDGSVVCSQIETDTETVTVVSLSVPTIVNNSPICEGEDGILQFSGDANSEITYTIDGGVNQNLTLDASGNFTLTLPTLTATTDVNILSVTNSSAVSCVIDVNSTETITVNPLPTVVDPNPIFACNDGTNPNSAPFDLDLQSADISNNEANVMVTYYETQALANTGNMADALVSPYDSTSANQTVYVRVETNLGCVDFTTLNLQVIDAPIANTPAILLSCDPSNQGIGTFNLTDAESEILAGNTQAVTVTYYSLQTEAIAGTPQITDPTLFTNNQAYNQTVYARVDSDATDCFSIAPIVLEVFDTPTVAAVQPLEVCDDFNNDGFAEFNLDSQTPLLLNGNTNITISYHASYTDAEDNLSQLTSPYTNTDNEQQTIYVRAENDLNPDCFSISTFDIVVIPAPTIINPTALQVCDDGTSDGITSIDLTLKDEEITGGNPNYSVSYHISQDDANDNINPLNSPYTNTVNGQIVHVRVEDLNTSCYNLTTLELLVEQAPSANTPTPLVFCDPDSDGVGMFDLTSKNDEITGGDPTLTVTYYDTPTNASNSVDEISSPYINISNGYQVVYARVESSTILTECETIVELELIVNPTPQLGNPPSPLAICDDVSGDGIGQFNLPSKEAEILENLADPTLYTVSFYILESDADLGTNPIANPNNFTNTSAFNQIIWVRVEDINSGCYKLTTLELIVNELPVLTQPSPLNLCDINNSGDEAEMFNLEDASSEILNGQTGIDLTYHLTQADANSGDNPISSLYTNVVNPQNIFVRATNETGCVNTITMLIRVNPIPSPTAPTDLEVCDDDNDGFASFNLEDKSSEIIGGEINTEVSYYETLEDAESGINPIVSPYTNIALNEQTIYIRLTNTLTDCYNASETLTLRVLEIPEVPTNVEEYTICDTDANGFAPFDLTTKNDEIIGVQSSVIITYHVTEADAQTGNNPISNPSNYTNTSNPQIIYVRLTSGDNGCFDIGEFNISVNLPPVAILPTPLELCDDNIDDEITVFNLTDKYIEITGGNNSYEVSFYETQIEAEALSNPVNDEAYINTSINGAAANPQTLYVVVTDTDTGCVDYTTLTIRVLPNPTPTEVLPEILLCDDNNIGDNIEVFDLTENETLILNGENGVTPTYYETIEDAEAGENNIVDPTMYTNINSPQVIYVRVTNDNSGCYTIVDFNIEVLPLPQSTAITDFIVCELNNDGIYSFDLSSKNEEILNSQSASDYTVSYHISQDDADNLMNSLVSPYTNISNPQQIFVAITNNSTGCSISNMSFNIEVQEAAEANSDMQPILYEICNSEVDIDEDSSNNYAEFDLFTQNEFVLDGQNPANYTVSYFASETDAELNVNSLPQSFTNTVNPQVIWARVDNNTPDIDGMDSSICYAVTPLTLRVNELPKFTLNEKYVLCINTNGTEMLDAPIIDTGLTTPNYNFVWYLNEEVIPGATEGSYMPTESGVYSVKVSDSFTSSVTMCESFASTTVITSEPPIISTNVSTDAFSELNTIEVTVTGSGIYEYSLDDDAWQDSSTFTNVSIGEHTVTARDKNGCGESYDTITIMGYPKYFTPNGDGIHDTWNITILENQEALISIFDRYGKLLKQISANGSGWNGTYNGNLMPSSDYWFVVEYNEPNTELKKEFRAHFALRR
ncbi:T9SS type B sorting domain-containing protein [Corallibacter sp.]|uniref:T9SS type B sorting domain-containing protein n=1 Tax=Corallibacter sp. TaxID=2038084 RepID=UPI003AB3DEBA